MTDQDQRPEYRGENSEYYGRDELSSVEMRELLDKTREIHAFVKGVADALNNPMVRAMMPPGMMGK